ncbi:MAG: hypothetical protein ABWK00_01900 [Desulfurococcaceae archaeon]
MRHLVVASPRMLRALCEAIRAADPRPHIVVASDDSAITAAAEGLGAEKAIVLDLSSPEPVERELALVDDAIVALDSDLASREVACRLRRAGVPVVVVVLNSGENAGLLAECAPDAVINVGGHVSEAVELAIGFERWSRVRTLERLGLHVATYRVTLRARLGVGVQAIRRSLEGLGVGYHVVDRQGRVVSDVDYILGEGDYLVLYSSDPSRLERAISTIGELFREAERALGMQTITLPK